MAVPQNTHKPGVAAAWLLASRPRTLGASVIPVLLGTALAFQHRVAVFPIALLALLGAVLLQVGTNLFNDWADFQLGADNAERLGPPRASANGWLKPLDVQRASLLAFGLATVGGVFLIVRGGWPVLVMGVFSLMAGVGYTAGRKSLAYLGLGEAAVALFFGPVAVAGTYYVQALTYHRSALILGLAVGVWCVGIMVVNNLRDIPTDVRVGKNTVAVRLGESGTRLLFAFTTLTPFLLIGMAVGTQTLRPALALVFLALPLAVFEIAKVYRRTGRELNASLVGAARFHMLTGLLLIAGVLLW